jgi:hypothetical protein
VLVLVFWLGDPRNASGWGYIGYRLAL